MGERAALWGWRTLDFEDEDEDDDEDDFEDEADPWLLAIRAKRG
jgi:hypothetical protein